uniref:Uncharacterized protein n=1 Tax=Physcomitrium patens TaxID=3218 RepID=A9RKH0_PHYPA|nr:hypothetical protein PHYPA_009223 [Physcomitrium patens]
MAMVVRTAGAWGVSTVAQVRCGVEPVLYAKQALMHSCNLSRRGNGLSISKSGDAALRCEAATLTAARVAIPDKVSGGGVEMRRMDETRAALCESLEVASVIRRVECISNEECRPIHGESKFVSCTVVESTVVGIELYQQCRVHHGKRGGGDAGLGLMTPLVVHKTAARDTQCKTEILANFEAVLQGASRNAEVLSKLALMAWRKLGDADMAEELYTEAIQLSPGDYTIQKSYAEFLWQCDA